MQESQQESMKGASGQNSQRSTREPWLSFTPGLIGFKRERCESLTRHRWNQVLGTCSPGGRGLISFGREDGLNHRGLRVTPRILLKDNTASTVQDVAQKTNEIAVFTGGDGTTTATVLARAIYAEGVKNVAAGCNPMDLCRGAQAAVQKVVQFLEANTKTITTTAEIAQVATISANGDEHIGGLIVQAMERVGKEGVITVKEGRTTEDEIEVTEGMHFDRSYISPYFITNVKTQKVDFEKPFILLSEKKISSLQDILPSLNTAASALRPLVIIAEDLDGEALAACILNKLCGQLQVVAVKAPTHATADLLGSTGSITITKEDTIVLNGAGSKDAISAWCEQIHALLNDPTTSEFDKTKLQERLVKLSGGVAVIKVGGSSEVEVGEKKDWYDDALNTTCAAVEEGILPGGGVALLKASLVLKTAAPGEPASSDPDIIPTANFDQGLGISIIRHALAQPARTILTNAGEEASVIVGTLINSSNNSFTYGYDTSKGEYTNMITRGIVDLLKVVRTALLDAAGVTSLLTTSECCIVDGEEEKPAGGMGGGMGGMGSIGMGRF
ncbi:chaperonin Cpn60/TCP-1 family [Suillus discolor]|uniref:Chaperonin Cpn60/TCP-1 family n=1 Tax=Suillus discolor TaxID=1912936 RepID=A0A9P7F6C6_9AGAM|nr:chaperonin Cpn60/TCP-1 family [Suillus discolor]KAG2107134.1 chaperonin Cpn60/TCP-1 family [Suillus discolor]